MNSVFCSVPNRDAIDGQGNLITPAAPDAKSSDDTEEAAESTEKVSIVRLVRG